MAVTSIISSDDETTVKRPISVWIAQELLLVLVVTTAAMYVLHFAGAFPQIAGEPINSAFEKVLFVLDIVWVAAALFAYWGSRTRRRFARILMAITLASIIPLVTLEIAAEPSFFGETSEDVENTVIGLVVAGPALAIPFIALPLMLLLSRKVRHYFGRTVAEPLSGPPPPPQFDR